MHEAAPDVEVVMRFGVMMVAMASLLVCAGGCGADEASDQAAMGASNFSYQNPIFQNTYLISAETVKTQVGGKVPAHPTKPSFNWQATHYKHVICAVFDEPLNIKDNLITNTDRMVWMWHSGLKAGREGYVEWSDGLADTVTGRAATDLSEGTYYWAVWALDLHGEPAFSTIENTHEVP